MAFNVKNGDCMCYTLAVLSAAPFRSMSDDFARTDFKCA